MPDTQLSQEPVTPPTRRNKRQRLLIGVCVLLLVDLIWVLSAELSEYIFHEEFNKPFFTTYFKTAMFVIYLFGFAFMKRWQYQFLLCISKTTKTLFKEVECISKHEGVNNLSVSENVSCSSTPVNLLEDHITAPTYENMMDDDISDDVSIGARKVSFSHVREVRSLAQQHSEAQVLARMSYTTIDELRKILLELNKKISLDETIKLSLIFVILWVFATLMYQEALSRTSAAVTNILSSTSGIFTLLLAALFPSSMSDKFTISKFLAVLVSFGSIFLVCWTDPSRKDATLNVGEIYALLGAILYASYLVLIRRRVGDDDKLDIPLFFGFVGLFGLLVFWPGFFILHYTDQETFELPSNIKTWLFLIINAVIGTVLSELLWLWGCFLTSSLMATLSLGLVMPLTMTYDVVINHINFSWLFIVGTIPIILSFLVVGVLTHYGDWDPIKDGFVYLFNCRWRKSQKIENEPLLNGSVNGGENT